MALDHQLILTKEGVDKTPSGWYNRYIKRREETIMRIYGMNKKACKGKWVVYTITNKSKYFLGAYRTEEKAQEVAKKYDGKYTLI